MKQLDRRWKVLLVTGVAVFMAFLDVTIVNVAFPSIGQAFPTTSLAGLSWVLNAYNIVFAALLVPAGRLADLLGRRRMFFVGMGLFLAASALCGLAPSAEFLIGARVRAGGGRGAARADLAGAAAAGVPARAARVGDGAVGRDRRRRGGDRAVAGRAADRVGGLAARVLRQPRAGRGGAGARRGGCCARRATRTAARCPTRSGIVLLAGGVGALSLAIVEAPDWGWGSARVLAAFAAAALLLAAFVLALGGARASGARAVAVPRALVRGGLRGRGRVRARLLRRAAGEHPLPDRRSGATRRWRPGSRSRPGR